MPRTVLLSLLLCLAPAAQADEALADTLRQHYLRGESAQAATVLQQTEGAASWADAQAQVTATFLSRAEGMTLQVTRRDARAPLVVAVPPGTFARPCRSDGPLPQELLFLRAPVLALRAGQRSARVQIPVACASFRRHGPEAGQVYQLEQARPGTALDRLGRVLCAGTLPPEPELALAIWIGHEGLGWERLAGSVSGFRTFRTPRQKVLPRHGEGAARILRRAGLDPLRFDFYREHPPAPAEDTPHTEPPAPKQPEAPQPQRRGIS